MPVTEPSQEYSKQLHKWKLVRDCCEGSSAIKSARKMDADSGTALTNEPGTLYLPAPNAEDDSHENRLRYQAYRQRANFVNFTGHTKEALIGMVCRQDPVIKLPPVMAEFQYNADGNGQSLYSCIKRSIDEVLKTGRYGVLTDYPTIEADAPLTRAQTQDIYPFIRYYNAESIINWRTKFINGRQKLCLVVLKEQVEEMQDEFSGEMEDQYRVLMLNDEGIYIQRKYDKNGELLVNAETGDGDIIPKQSNGSPWDEIPFTFIGATNNDDKPDKSPLYDMAEINIAHYRNSADYEESCFIVGQPTPALAGLTKMWVKDVMDGKIHLGSRGAIMLPEGGSATLLQANPNQMPAEGMDRKEKQMIQIGAKLITDQGGHAETAEAAKIRFAGQNSKLATIVDNVKEAHEKAIEWAMLFQGASGEVSIDINKDFYERTVNPQLLMAKIQLVDRGILAADDIRDDLRSMGEIDEERTNEDIEDTVREVNPFK